jgi:hypothetical protein
MNARLHPTVTAVLASTQRYAVTLTFTDGVYKNFAHAADERRAAELALIDARMASPFNTHCGALISSDAQLVPP